MARPPLKTIRDTLYWSYSNLAMAHAALTDHAEKYQRVHFMVRSRLFKGLMTGAMDLGSIWIDERQKAEISHLCCYCGCDGKLSADHLIPKKRGGQDVGENLVWVCRACNSSKGAKDLLQWMGERGQFPPLHLLRRYLKLAIRFCEENGLMDTPIAAVDTQDFPFLLQHVPLEYPAPCQLRFWGG